MDQPKGEESRSRLQDELRQGRPFHSKGQEAFLALLRTADVAKRRFTDLLDAEGVTLQQYNVLRILRGAGGDGLPTLEIATRMIERTPGVTRIVDRLQAKGLAARGRRRDDRRRVWCQITSTGLELLAKLDDPVKKADGETVKGLSEDEVVRLIELLDRIRCTAEADLR
ncbi:MAG: MarR family transcriptional regulator [Gemmatimonadota bacterium]